MHGARVRPRFAMFLVACSQAPASVSMPDAGSPDRPDARPLPSDAPIDAPAPRALSVQASGATRRADAAGTSRADRRIVPGVNTIASSGQPRQFILVVPEGAQPGEVFPVLFMWHWIGGSASSFLEKGDVQAAANLQRFIAVIPFSIGANVIGTSFDTKWPFDISQSNDRMQKEFRFFDDMLSCVHAQYAIERTCVSSIGVSAGALFTAQARASAQPVPGVVRVAVGRRERDVDPAVEPGGAPAARRGAVGRRWPAGAGRREGHPRVRRDRDGLLGRLEVARARARRDGHFFIECKHNCGHVEPPLTTPAGESRYAGMWEFAMDHPYWLAAGDSPYKAEGLPPTLPSWCAIGANDAIPRSGAGCPAAENPCTN